MSFPHEKCSLVKILGLLFLTACGSAPHFVGYSISSANNSSLRAGVGDAIALSVIEKMSDGTSAALPTDAVVRWSGPPVITAAAPDARDLPTPTDAATGIFVLNALRPEHTHDLNGVLFVLDGGTSAEPSITVTATVSGSVASGSATADVFINGGLPPGDASRGAKAWGESGANCAACHGATGHGSPDNGDGTFTYGGKTYDFAAPGLNHEPGNLANDPTWSAPLLAMSARADIDNGGVVLRAPMPDFLTYTSATQLHPLTAADFADIYLFLQEQSE